MENQDKIHQIKEEMMFANRAVVTCQAHSPLFTYTVHNLKALQHILRVIHLWLLHLINAH